MDIKKGLNLIQYVKVELTVFALFFFELFSCDD